MAADSCLDVINLLTPKDLRNKASLTLYEMFYNNIAGKHDNEIYLRESCWLDYEKPLSLVYILKKSLVKMTTCYIHTYIHTYTYIYIYI